MLVILLLGFGWWVWHSGDTSRWSDQTDYVAIAESTPAATVVRQATPVVMDNIQDLPTAEALPTSSTPTLTPLVVTPMPTDADVFAAATRAVEATRIAAEIGTATPTPPNLVTATFTPTPFVIVNTPTPENQATAIYLDMLAQAEALTTGTPTPFPAGAVTATPRPTSLPWTSGAGGSGEATSVTPTITPVYVLLSDTEGLSHYVWPTVTPVPTPSALPAVLTGKIGFRSEMLGWQRTFVVDPDGDNLAILVDSWPYDQMLAQERISADNRYYVFQGQGRNGTDLYLGYADGRSPVKLTAVGQGLAYDPAWAPDEQRIVFASNQEGDDDIFALEIRGLDDPNPHVTKLTNGDTWESDKHPSYSPDGSQIVFYSNRTGRNQIWIMNSDGSDPHLVFEADEDCWDPVWFKP
jgi:hypothetical protein